MVLWSNERLPLPAIRKPQYAIAKVQGITRRLLIGAHLFRTEIPTHSFVRLKAVDMIMARLLGNNCHDLGHQDSPVDQGSIPGHPSNMANGVDASLPLHSLTRLQGSVQTRTNGAESRNPRSSIFRAVQRRSGKLPDLFRVLRQESIQFGNEGRHLGILRSLSLLTQVSDLVFYGIDMKHADNLANKYRGALSRGNTVDAVVAAGSFPSG